MRKILLVAFVFLSFGVLAAKADNDRVITKEKLPLASQQFISENFGNLKISYVKEERDFLERSYEVVFTNGTKIEFIRNGDWKEVDCRYSNVPAEIIPERIAKYVSEHYSDAQILQIERSRSDYEVRLSNKLELTFDKKFNIIDIDD